MITVIKHGENYKGYMNEFTTPVREAIMAGEMAMPKEVDLTDVTFREEKRTGEQASYTDKLGEENYRECTIAVETKDLDKYYLGRGFPTMFVNVALFTTPQVPEDMDVAPRMLDEQPTYFKTWISDKAEIDIDNRMDKEVVRQYAPYLLEGRAHA